jgi:hypothetical protein
MRSIVITVPDTDKAFIDYFIHYEELRDIGKKMGIGPSVMSRIMKAKHRSVSLWAKRNKLPRIEMGCDCGSPFKWAAIDGDGRIEKESNRQHHLFPYVIMMLKRRGLDPVAYIEGKINIT